MTISELVSGDPGSKEYVANLYSLTVILKIAQAFTYQEPAIPFVLNILDTLMGFGGLSLTVIQLVEKHDAKGIWSFFAGLMWNLNRILSVGTSKRLFAPYSGVFIIAKAVLIELHGIVHLILAIEN